MFNPKSIRNCTFILYAEQYPVYNFMFEITAFDKSRKFCNFNKYTRMLGEIQRTYVVGSFDDVLIS